MGKLRKSKKRKNVMDNFRSRLKVTNQKRWVL